MGKAQISNTEDFGRWLARVWGFATVHANPCTHAMSVVCSPSSWLCQSSALAGFCYDKISLLSSHFSPPLQRTGFSPDCYSEEWAELMLCMRQTLIQEPEVSYLSMWKRILEEYKNHPAHTNILGLLRITLVIPVQTTTLEWEYSLIKGIKVIGITDSPQTPSHLTIKSLMILGLTNLKLNQLSTEGPSWLSTWYV